MGLGTVAAPPTHYEPKTDTVATPTRAAGLRAVATFEAIKGVIVLLLGLGILTLLHRDAERTAESLLTHLHLSPEHHLGHVILRAASGLTDGRLWALAAGAVAYSAVRFTEAWGLWNRRVWAEWFALLSGLLYVPWEIVEVVQRPNWIHMGLLAGNLLIVGYMLFIRIDACRIWKCREPEEVDIEA